MLGLFLRSKQRTAFPPNFVHSLDSTHMLLTALRCRDAGILFAGVHDSYWTHACHVEDMGRLLRETFVELHSEPLLEQLRDQFEEEYPNLAPFPQLPKKGNLDLNQVLESEYFFS